jgi:hypothetical protein
MTDCNSSNLKVIGADDWELVNDALDGFDDGIVKEIWLDRAAWLTEDDQLAEQGYPTAVIVVQLQSARTRSARLRFEGVRAVTFDLGRDVRPARARPERDGWEVEFLSCRVAASSCTVEILGDRWLGPGPFLLRDDGA